MKKLAIAAAVTGLGAAGAAIPAFAQTTTVTCPPGATNPAYCTTTTTPPPTTTPVPPAPTDSVVLRSLSVNRIVQGRGRNRARVTRATTRITLSNAASSVRLSFRQNGKTVVKTADAGDVGAGRKTIRFVFSKKLDRGDYSAVVSATIGGKLYKDRADITISRRGTGRVSASN